MVSYKDMTLKERLEQKIFDEEMKAMWKEIGDGSDLEKKQKEYLKYIMIKWNMIKNLQKSLLKNYLKKE